MKFNKLLLIIVMTFVAAVATATDGQGDRPVGKESMQMKSNEILDALIGSWEGSCKTWFRPGKLADESKIKGEFSKVMDGKFVRHTYKSTLQGKPRHGEELITFNSVTIGTINPIKQL